ncbi:MAG: PD-(D/E)XK nuclease family protein [Jhaorihella sp.]
MKPTEIAWSHSALARYENCPHQYYREKVVKDVPFVETEALKKGNDMHKVLELKVDKGVPLPSRWEHLEPVASYVASLPNVKVEEEFAFTCELERCEWFDRKRKVWSRCKIDVQSFFSPEVAMVVDYKSGGYYGDDKQAGTTALTMFWAYPELQTVSTVWYYVEKDKKVGDTFTRQQMPELMERPLGTLSDISKSYRTERWPKQPHFGCKFCGVTDCEFRGKSHR